MEFIFNPGDLIASTASPGTHVSFCLVLRIDIYTVEVFNFSLSTTQTVYHQALKYVYKIV
jgi:hypothetical protein